MSTKVSWSIVDDLSCRRHSEETTIEGFGFTEMAIRSFQDALELFELRREEYKRRYEKKQEAEVKP